MNICLSTSDISIAISVISLILIIITQIIGTRKLISTHRKVINDQAMIFGVKNGYTDKQLIEICEQNKIKYPRDTVAFYRYYYQLKDKQ
jgi:cell division protein YceG involved in septum cleavage